MTEDQTAALAWLETVAAYAGQDFVTKEAGKHLATFKAMLAEPRLPKEPSDAAINAMMQHGWDAKDIYRALYAHLTAPKTKTFRLWYAHVGHRDVPQERALEMVANAMAQGKPITIEPEGT